MYSICSERTVPLSVDHFNQNGNIKSIAHIDADVNVENENDANDSQKTISTSPAEKFELKITSKADAIDTVTKVASEEKEKDSGYQLWKYPSHKSGWHQAMWIIIWPTNLLFILTIPNCEQKRFKNLFPLTFLMCIVWIGSLSYLVAWMITIVGKSDA